MIKKNENAKAASVVSKYMLNPPLRRQAHYKFEDNADKMLKQQNSKLNKLHKILR